MADFDPNAYAATPDPPAQGFNPDAYASEPAPDDLRGLADAAADRHGIPRHIFRGMVQQESAWNPKAQPFDNDGNLLSSAKGLTQIIDSTAKDLGVEDRFDPAQSLEGGAKYLKQMHAQFGDWDSALQAYHDGPGNFADAGPSQDAQKYLRYVKGYADQELQDAGEDQPQQTPSPSSDAALATYKATNAKLSPDDAAEALDHSSTTGLGPTFVASALPTVRKAQAQAQMRATLAPAPVTAGWMAQSPAHAAAAQDDVGTLTNFEWIFGRDRHIPHAAAEEAPTDPLAFQVGSDIENVVPSQLAYGYAKGIFGLRAAGFGILSMLPRIPGPGQDEPLTLTDLMTGKAESKAKSSLTTKDKKLMAQALEYASAPMIDAEGHIGRQMFGATSEAIPQLAPFLAGGWASLPFLFAQTLGQMKNQFAGQTNEDGTKKYTEEQANRLAAGGATATTVLLGGVAGKFGKGIAAGGVSLLPKSAQGTFARIAANVFGARWLRGPAVLRNLEAANLRALRALGRSNTLRAKAALFGLGVKDSIIHGAMFMAGLSMVNDLTSQTGEVMTGGKLDLSKTYHAAKESAEHSLMLLPVMLVGPTAGLARDIGRVRKAQRNAVDLAAAIGNAKESKLIKRSPEAARDLLAKQSDAERYGPKADPAEDKSTAFIPTQAFDAAIREAGLDPAEVAKSLHGDDGSAYQEAQATGQLAVPMADVLTKLASQGLADKLLADMKTDGTAEGMTPREAKAMEPILDGTLRDMHEALTVDEARAMYQSIAADDQIGLQQPIAADLSPAQAKLLEGEQNSKETTPGKGQKTPESAPPEDPTAAWTPEQKAAWSEQTKRWREAQQDGDEMQAIYAREHAAMLAVGQTEEAADVFASVRARIAATMGQRYGGSPEWWHRKLGDLRLHQGGDPAASALAQEARNPAGWFSSVERAVEGAKQEKNTPEAWLALLSKSPGVKAEEMDYLGLREWLEKQKSSVTRAEIAGFVNAHRIEVREQVLGGAPPPEALTEVEKAYEKAAGQWTGDIKSDEPWASETDESLNEQRDAQQAEQHGANAIAAAREGRWGRALDDARQAAEFERPYGGLRWQNLENKIARAADSSGQTSYEPYTTGLADEGTYRELLLYAPGDNAYEAPHFRDAPGINRNVPAARAEGGNRGLLAHVRFGDRIDEAGKKTLVIEEIQSDMHQEGRSKGYSDGTELAKLEAERSTIGTEKADLRVEHRALWEGGKLNAEHELADPVEAARSKEILARINAIAARIDEIDPQIRAAERAVPDAPFKTTWEDLAVKRMVRYAAENGYDKLAWTTGAVHTGRYGTEQIQWERVPREEMQAALADTTPSYKRGDPAGELREAVGRADASADFRGLSESGPVWRVHVSSQKGGEAAGINIEAEAARRGLLKGGTEIVTSKEELSRAMSDALGSNKHVEKVWERMQKDDEGVSRPRAEGFDQAYDKRITGAFKKILEKYGAKVEKESIQPHEYSGNPGKVPMFTAEMPEKLAADVKAKGLPLFQPAREGGPVSAKIEGGRAFISFNKPGAPLQADLHFLHAADPSSGLHELAHFMLEAEGRIALEPDAPEALKADYQTALRDLDYSSPADRSAHAAERESLAAKTDRTPEEDARLNDLTSKEEKFSHLFETYLAEGKAPTPALKSLFARLREMLLQVYGSIKNIAKQYKEAFGKELEMSPAMRGFFDKLLAEDQPKRPQPEALAQANAEAKLGRDWQKIIAAGAEARVSTMKIADLKPWVYENLAEQNAGKMMVLGDRIHAEKNRGDPAVAKVLDTALGELQGKHIGADAMAKAVTSAKDRADSLEMTINQAARDQVRGDFARGGRAFLDAYDAIMGGIGKRPVSPTATVDNAVATIEANLGDVGFEPAALHAILGRRLTFPAMTVEEAELVHGALTSIRRGARDAVEDIYEGKRQETATMVDKVKATLAKRTGSGGGDFSPVSGVKGAPGPKGFTGKGKAILTEMLQPQELLRRIGLEDVYHRDFVEARNHREEMAAKIGDYFTEHYEEAMPKEMKARKLEPVEGVGGKFPGKMVRQDLWELASWMGSESSAERVSKGLGVSGEQIHRVLEQLEKPEWDFIQSRWDFSDKEVWPLLSDYVANKVGLAPPKIDARPITTKFGEYRGGYHPARYRYDLGREQGAMVAEGVADAWGELRKGFPSASNYFTKPRAQKFFDVPDLQWNAFPAHLHAVSHYLAMDGFVTSFGKLLRNAEFRDTIRNADGLGEEALTQLGEFHKTTARGMVEEAKGGAWQTARLYGGGFLRSRVGTAAFQLNIRVVAGQLSHLFAAMPALGIRPDHMARGVFAALRPSTYEKAFANSQQLSYRWNDYGAKTREMLHGIGPEGRSEGSKWIDTAGWSLYHVMDGFLSRSIHEAAFLKAKGGENVSDADAYYAADKALSKIMPPRNIMEQSSFARDRGIIGSMMLVRNFPNTIYNVSAAELWDAQTKVHEAAPGWSKAKAYAGGTAAAAGTLLGTYLAVHILGRYIMGHGAEHDEKPSKWLFREALSAPLYQFGPLEDAADPFIRALVSGQSLKYQIAHGHSGFKNAPIIEFFNNTIKDASEVMSASSPKEKRAMAALRQIGRWSGAPTSMLPSLQYGYDLGTGKAHPHDGPRGAFDIGSGLFYGKRDKQAGNPLSDIAKALR